ncbi:hypothetical protein [Micromonospora sp. CPCC 206061]|uniref:hypothetical protein n=1 Tax=Micromonospora sp. CPCC 206061 TaxID=3122410 RepID=UPI002FF06EEC
MLKRLAVRGVVATVAVTGIAVPTAPRPAQAVDPATFIQIAQYAYAAYNLYNESRSGGLTLELAVGMMINEVRRSEQAIKNHMDALTVAEVRGCAEHAMLEFVESPEFSLSLKQRFAQDATACVTAINARYDAVAGNYNYAALRDLAVLMVTLGPVALAARAQARLQTAQLEQYLIPVFNKMLSTFQVSCHMYFDRFYLPIPDEENVWQVYPELYIPGFFVCGEHHDGAMAQRHEYALWYWGAFKAFPDPANPGRMLDYYPHFQLLRDEVAQRSLNGLLTAAVAELQS